MNAELLKIRRSNRLSDEMRNQPIRLSEEDRKDMIYELNCNIGDLYSSSKKYSLEDYVGAFTKNIYIILEMFNKMGIYPDYFFDIEFLHNIEFHKFAKANNSKMSWSQLRDKFIPLTNVDEKIRDGLDKVYYKIHASKERNLNDYFVEMISLHQVFGLPYNNSSPENCRKAYVDANNTHTSIINNFYVSDYLYEDVDCLASLLYVYMTFFVEIGVNPKEYVENYIESMRKGRRK